MMSKINTYLAFNRKEWAAFQHAIPMMLAESELSSLQGLNEDLSMEEVEAIYLPLSRLIDNYFNTKMCQNSTLTDSSSKIQKAPYIIGIAGSVAVGKSTTARVIQALLSRWPGQRRVALVTTDGFLYSNRELSSRGIMNKKGFPESYDQKKLLQFMSSLKSGQNAVKAPVYSHLIYDIVPDKILTINSPDILILEGLNVLQRKQPPLRFKHSVFVSDYIDFSIFVDADPKLLQQWYISRFLKFRAGAFSNPNAYFHHYSQLSKTDAIAVANKIWNEINRPNLIENILPTREQANLILTKGKLHKVERIYLRN